MKRNILLLVLLLACTYVWGQHSCVIADMESRLPLKDALIHTNTNHWAKTDYTGQFEMKYYFDSLTVSKNGYVKVTVRLEAIPDTIFLLPQARQLTEVQVWGTKEQHLRDMMDHIRTNISQTPSSTSGIGGMDFLGWLDRRAKRDARHKRKAGEVFRELDKAGDPIEEAYKQAMEELKKNKNDIK